MEENIQLNIEGFDPAIAELLINSFNSSEVQQSNVNINSNDITPEEVAPRKIKKTTTTNKKVDTEVPKIEQQNVNEVAWERSGKNQFIDLLTNYIYPAFSKVDFKDEEKFNIKFDEPSCIKLNPNMDIDIVVIGCGGNGSRLLNLLAQQAYSNKRISNITLYDDDIVEPKNLTRQLFYEFEVGELKAQALADRYSMLYGIKITPKNIKFTTRELENFISGRQSNRQLVIFDCVDNKDGRVQSENLLDMYAKKVSENSSRDMMLLESLTIISCGNQKDHGQVHVGYINRNHKDSIISSIFNSSLNDTSFDSTIIWSKNHGYNNNYLTTIPIKCLTSIVNSLPTYLSPFLEYNKTFEDSKESVSCADMEIAEEQSMAINATIAQLAFNIFFEMLVNKDGLKNAMIFANLSNDYSVQPINTKETLIDHYLKTIFGKNIFFEKDMCFDQLCRSLDIYNYLVSTKEVKYEYINQYYSVDIIEYIKNTIMQKRESYSKLHTDTLNEYFDIYFNEIIDNLIEFIDKQYSDKLSFNYIEYNLFIVLVDMLLRQHFVILYNKLCSYNYNSGYAFSNTAIRKLREYEEKIINVFNQRYSDIAKNSSFEYFKK